MPQPSATTVHHGLLADFQALFASLPSNAKVSGQKVYSHVPTNMGKEWLAAAYDPDDQPAGRAVNVSLFLDKVPLRKTSSLLNTNKRSVATPQQQTPDTQQVLFNQLWGSLLKTWQGKSEEANAGCTVHFTNKTPGNQPRQLQLPPVPAPQSALEPKPKEELQPASLQDTPCTEDAAVQKASVLPLDQPGHGGGLADFEKAAFEKLHERASGNKPGQKQQKGNKVLKRPSAQKTKVCQSSPSVKQSSNGLPSVLGCLRCKGASKGCATCRKPEFKGIRFQGREEYNRFVLEQKAAGKTYK